MIAIPREYTARVTETKYLSPKIIFLRVEPQTPVPFVAGQYASFLIEHHRRPLSFANIPTDASIEFIVDISPQGVCSQYVMHCQVGDTIRFLAPYGRFTLKTGDTRPHLFIATGSGIAPIRGHIQQLLHDQTTIPFTLLFGNRHEEYMILHDELTALAQAHPHFTYIPILSEPSPTWQGYKGLVTQATLDLIPSLADYSIYICGSPAMVQDMTAVLRNQGLPLEYVYREHF